jgi:hypothetical protein
MRVSRLCYTVVGLALLGCDESRQLTPLASVDPRLSRSLTQEVDEVGSAQGNGRYDVLGLIVEFSFTAHTKDNGQGNKGEFRVYADEGDGLIVDFEAKVTCLGLDPVNHRAWVGGKVKENRSTDPTLLTAIHEKGDDIWFRVLDDPSGDRSSFVGFEGAAGFATSAAYCAGKPWPDGNARTWPVVAGGIAVQP